MNLQSLFQDFNPSKFVVYTCLLLFSLLVALRLDGTIHWSWWAVFAPLWVWKVAVISGMTVGTIVWIRHPQYRADGAVPFRAMLASGGLQMLLLSSELLACDRLQSGRYYWMLVCTPLLMAALLSVIACVWALRHDRSFELELFCSVNTLQFVFLALRLDEIITWNWVVVLVPAWIVMCVALIGVLYAVIFASVLMRAPEVAPEQRRSSARSAAACSVVVLPQLVFLVMLCNKLDSESSLSYVATCTPLYFTFLVLVFLSFSSKGGNHWWFGIRKDFCHFVLSACPLLREYGNISYSLHSNEPENAAHEMAPERIKPTRLKRAPQSELRAIVPALCIETPD